MIALTQTLFGRAERKARNVQPFVTRAGTNYQVSRADGNVATVKFTARAGQLWASCTCPAGSPAGHNLPLPCYHVAAAVLLARQPKPDHQHMCQLCGARSVYGCNCPTPGAHNYDCDCVDALADSHRDSDYWV